MFEQIRSKQQQLEAQIKALRDEAAALVKPRLQEFMKAHPTVKQVKWTQYTPYFNDGDTCTFRLNSVGFYFEGDDLEGSAGEFELWGEYDSTYNKDRAALIGREAWDACKEFSKGLNSIDDALLSLFGDHVEVTVTPDGVSVDEYEHE